MTDEQAELTSALRKMAADRGLEPRVGNVAAGELRVGAHPVVHTSHPAYGYRIRAAGGVVVV